MDGRVKPWKMKTKKCRKVFRWKLWWIHRRNKTIITWKTLFSSSENWSFPPGELYKYIQYLPSTFILHIWSYLCTVWIKHWWFIFMFMRLNYIIERFSVSKLHMYRISESEENNSEYTDLTAQNTQSCTLHHCFCLKQTTNHTDELVYWVKNTEACHENTHVWPSTCRQCDGRPPSAQQKV